MPRDSSSSDDRIAKLSQRFKTHAVGRRPQATPRTRERHSLYLDTELIAQASQAYRDISHELYPQTVSKSEFWEALLGYGLPASSQQLPDGPGKELAETNCNSCHTLSSRVGAGYTPEGWTTVLRMMANQGVSLPPDQAEPLKAYLIKSFP